MMGTPIALPLWRNSFIGSLGIGLVDEHIAALAMLGEAGRRRRVAGNNDHPVGCLEPKSDRSQLAVPHRKGSDTDVAVRVDRAGRNLVRIHPAAARRQAVDA